MANLFRYTCKPNYPVIPKASVMFYSDLYSEEDAKELGTKLAQFCGIYNCTKDAGIEYLGDFHPTKDFDNNIIAYETGEY